MEEEFEEIELEDPFDTVEEMEEVYKHSVYSKAPIQECWDKTGRAPVKVR